MGCRVVVKRRRTTKEKAIQSKAHFSRVPVFCNYKAAIVEGSKAASTCWKQCSRVLGAIESG